MSICWMIFLAIAVAVPMAVAEDTSFFYAEHGKRDPFLPLVSPTGSVIVYDEDITASDMSLEGIAADKNGNNIAIINGKVVKTKDSLGAFVVDAIADDHVDMLKGQEHFTLKLKKGGM